MSEIIAMPVQPLETNLAEIENAAEASKHTNWRQRLGQVAGRAALALGIASGMVGTGLATEQTPAEASAATCYGDYCSGLYANETGCDENVKTIAQKKVMQNGLELSAELSQNPSLGFNTSGNSNEVGTLELRYSEKCGTYWGRFKSTAGSGINIRGINFVGIEQDGGYTQKRDIGGLFNGSPEAISFTPMIYGRGRAYHAFVEAKDYTIAYRVNTEWVEN